MNPIRLVSVLSLLCSLSVVPVLAQEWSTMEKSAVDGIKTAYTCISRPNAPAIVKVKILNTTTDPMSGWWSLASATGEGAHKAFALKPKGFVIGSEMAPGTCTQAITVNVGSAAQPAASP